MASINNCDGQEKDQQHGSRSADGSIYDNYAARRSENNVINKGE